MKILYTATLVFLLTGLTNTFALGWVAESSLSKPQQKEFIRLKSRAQKAYTVGNYGRANSYFTKIYAFAKKAQNRAFALVNSGYSVQGSGKLFAAHEIYQNAIKKFPGLIDFKTIQNKEEKIAEYLYTEKINNIHWYTSFDQPIKVYRDIIKNSPFSKQTPLGYLRIAEMQALQGEEEEAVQSYLKILSKYPKAEVAADARFALGEYYLEVSRDADGDGELIKNAKSQFTLFINAYPKHKKKDAASKYLTQIREQQAEKLYKLAAFYTWEAHKRPETSKRYLRDLIRKYENTKMIPNAQALLAALENGDSTIIKEKSRITNNTNSTPKVKGTVIYTKEMRSKDKNIIIHPDESDGRWMLPIRDLNNLKKKTDVKRDKK